ncbi:Ase1p CYBJADRAFT_166186 [Cyberlindnera jadinii NRRL Y-1542]|uniref:Uncharacterized protein n=1 Tax=Cyberlindnera jadinii (strain ATCC 18201 / CBS 1600 / BCRC 20928 / JCM 3617 / NBRC 0987 / NRRL Y-1542) TaxID=983966 RepID=A0A1E4S7L4_CYBJN|nr:hypothetical protein CYBJADRAFT_166186 [Cyberlindnera jadinii NRRL Y-1542]ODV75453.1 hypothetical protein CYBJADRAFT_166186 [Cyberlindnera jadinii NRRL Y-1542]
MDLVATYSSPGREAQADNKIPKTGMINLLSSPMKVKLNSGKYESSPSPTSSKNRGNDGDYSRLASELTNTLSKLADINTTIGYNKNELQNKEEELFDAVYGTLDKFIQDAETYKNSLDKENNSTITILRKVLRTIQDPTGTRTIPDLYIRNLILKDIQNDVSMLSLRNSLSSSLDYILTDYRDRLFKYLELCHTLDLLRSRCDGFSVTNLEIPPGEQRRQILQFLEQHSSISDTFQILLNDQTLLLETSPMNDLSDECLDHLSRSITQYNQEISSRLCNLRKLSSSIISLWHELDIDHKTDFFMISDRVFQYSQCNEKSESLDVSVDIISELNKLLKDLESVKSDRLELINNFKSKCEPLWEKLEQDPRMIEEFKSSNSDISSKTIENYEMELARMEALKAQFLDKFINDAKISIEELWDQLCYSDSQRSKCEIYYSTDCTDEVLSQLEEEIGRLNKILASYKPIIDLVQQFKSLIQDRTELEATSQDSSRLLAKNSYKILMEEEKTRKRLARQLPKLISELRVKIKQYEDDNDESLSYLGADFLELLDEEQKKLESKGRRVLSGTSARSQPPSQSRPISRDPSRSASRITSRAPSRAPSRPVSKAPSRISSRATSPVKSSISNMRNPTKGVQKPVRKPMSANNSSLGQTNLRSSPSKVAGSLTITSDLTKDRRLPSLKPPIKITRSTSAFQPRLMSLSETSNGSPPRRTRLPPSPLKAGNHSKLPVLGSRNENSQKVMTSPLKSLSKGINYDDEYDNGDKENREDLTNSDQESTMIDDDTYSTWRKEQLRKLNHLVRESDTF